MPSWLTPISHTCLRVMRFVPGLTSFADRKLSRSEIAAVISALGALAGCNDRFKGPLTRIADGCGTRGDIEEIKSQLVSSHRTVGDALKGLRVARYKVLERKFGRKLARDIEGVLWQEIGPHTIRTNLKKIALAEVQDVTLAAGTVILIHNFDLLVGQVRAVRRTGSSRRDDAQTADSRSDEHLAD